MLIDNLKYKLKKPAHDTRYRTFWQYIHIDIILLTFLVMLCSAGLLILYSASNQNMRAIEYQVAHLLLAFGVMFVIAQIPPVSLRRSAPVIYIIGLLLLAVVLVTGHIGKGAQRWLNVGFTHFQPAELMKLAIPLYLPGIITVSVCQSRFILCCWLCLSS